MTKDEALRFALEALETELAIDWTNNDEFNLSAEKMHEAITAIKEALAQPEQEPVAWFSPSGNLYKTRFHATANGEQVVTPLYTTPPQTDEFKCPLCYDDIANIKNPSQPEQEPVTNDLLRRAWDALDAFKQAYPENWNQEDEQVLEDLMKTDLKLSGVKLKWVGLTDEEIAQGCKESWVTEQAFQSAVWWAEEKLKEKNSA